MEIKDLKQDSHNYRKHNDRNRELIKKSVDECGLGRSVVIDSENCIVAGNGLVSTLDKNTKVKVIETDGSELVVVKRTDLKTDDEKRKKLAIMDNSTSDTSEFDLELLSVDFEVPELKDMGIDIPSIDDCETDMPNLASGDKEPFQQMTFTLADGQAETIKEALSKAKGDSNFDYVDKMGNENSNGNALFFIVQEWQNGKC